MSATEAPRKRCPFHGRPCPSETFVERIEGETFNLGPHLCQAYNEKTGRCWLLTHLFWLGKAAALFCEGQDEEDEETFDEDVCGPH